MDSTGKTTNIKTRGSDIGFISLLNQWTVWKIIVSLFPPWYSCISQTSICSYCFLPWHLFFDPL